MALVGNFSVLNKTAGKWLAGGSVAGAAQAFTRANTNKPSDWRKFSTQDRAGGTGEILKLAALPSGYYPPGAWGLPTQAGALSSYLLLSGSATAVVAVSGGVAAVAALAGVAAMTATGALIVSGAATAAGTSTMTGDVTAALNGSASIGGTSSTACAVTGIGHMTATSSGVRALTGTRYALGHLSADVTPFTELSPQSLAASVMDAIVESGLSVREALQVILAANGGIVEDAETGTIRFRDQADTKDRITATVDVNGNRTSVTLDTDG